MSTQDGKIRDLADTLLKINRNEIPIEEAKDILGRVSEVDISLAEQLLLERGVTPLELQGLCKAHMSVLEDKVAEVKSRTQPGHPIYTLISEHELILGFLDNLESLSEFVEAARGNAWPAASERALKELHNLAYHLVETEKHHEREEDALFPAIEEFGITGPTRIMTLEHQQLRPVKSSLLKLSQVALSGESDFAAFKKELLRLTTLLIPALREHILKENTILYPAALDAITSPEKWKEIRAKSDEIGYCCFTPNH